MRYFSYAMLFAKTTGRMTLAQGFQKTTSLWFSVAYLADQLKSCKSNVYYFLSSHDGLPKGFNKSHTHIPQPFGLF